MKPLYSMYLILLAAMVTVADNDDYTAPASNRMLGLEDFAIIGGGAFALLAFCWVIGFLIHRWIWRAQ